jgi:hypothetical protein
LGRGWEEEGLGGKKKKSNEKVRKSDKQRRAERYAW